MADVNRNLEQRTAELLASSLKISQEKPPKQTRSGPESASDSSLEDQLAKAKASRNQAESARQKIANEILEATKEVCQKLIKDGEQTLEKAKKLEVEAQQKQREAKAELEKAQAVRAEAETYAERLKSEAQAIRSETDDYRERVMAEVQQQAHGRLDQAQNIRHEADAYRERVITEAKDQGQEILYLARSGAEQECNEMKKQASLEVQRTIAEAELIKAASQEELEAQRIYAETARLEAESLEVLAQVRAKLGESSESPPASACVKSPDFQLNPVWKSLSQVHGPTHTPEAEPEFAMESPEEPAPVEPASKSPRSKRSRSGSR